MSEIPFEVAMHAERLYDEGGYEGVPTIIAKAIMAEREANQNRISQLEAELSQETERCAKIAEDAGHWEAVAPPGMYSAPYGSTAVWVGLDGAAIAKAIRG